ncbi:MAG: peptidoglycan DD-metalloendopeptidase family protein [Selenomonadaceae bacterium]|nr:peptidoglycan DD-metalloendopeptidase family protein [Selenomonadaceae bacterium]
MMTIILMSSLTEADEIEKLENKKAAYEALAQRAIQKADLIQERIDSISEYKRVLDEEADVAIAEFNERQAALDETLKRIADNENTLKSLQQEYNQKHAQLSKRVRDIYIHGQISYLDLIFGSKDFDDFLTRMDLLRRLIKQDCDLVQSILQNQTDVKSIISQLESDRAAQTELVEKAERAKEVKLSKVEKQQELINKMQSDKEIYNQQYDELMAASQQIAVLIYQSKYKYTAAGAGGMVWPIAGTITSQFGWRTHPIFGDRRFHSGIDIGGDYGMEIHAAKAGIVTHAGWISGYGNTVMIEHGGGIVTLYGHNQSLDVNVGQQVLQGQVIAHCGSTGNATGPHCHFEVRLNGEPVSPYEYIMQN